MSARGEKGAPSDEERDDRGKGAPPRAGSVAPADPQLVEWLERLWTRGNHPDRLEVWRVVGSTRDVRRAMIFYENFQQDDPLDIERCTRLAGEILSAAQNDCDCAEKRSLYEIAISDPYQKTQPLLRRLGPLVPQRAYAGAHPDGGPKGAEDEEDEGAGIGLKPITHKYLRQTIRSLDRGLQQVLVSLGDTVTLQQGIVVSQQGSIEKLMQGIFTLHEQTQQAMDRSTERTIWVKREEMKMKAIGSGLKVGENLLYGWFGKPDEDETGEAAASGGSDKPAPQQRRHPATPEQRLVESFLEEAADEKLSVQLFGDWKNTTDLSLQDVFAGCGLETPGIFHPQQFGILLAVREGLLPASALDPLLHDSGKPQALTLEQMLKAQPLMTRSMMVALDQIRQLRLAAQKKQAPSAAPPQQQGEKK